MRHRPAMAFIVFSLGRLFPRPRHRPDRHSGEEDAVRELMKKGGARLSRARHRGRSSRAPSIRHLPRGTGRRLRVQVVGKAVLDLIVTVDPEGLDGPFPVSARWRSPAPCSQRRGSGSRLPEDPASRCGDRRPLVEMRRFKVFVLGNVVVPGTYPVTAASRVSEAVFLRGGEPPRRLASARFASCARGRRSP